MQKKALSTILSIIFSITVVWGISGCCVDGHYRHAPLNQSYGTHD